MEGRGRPESQGSSSKRQMDRHKIKSKVCNFCGQEISRTRYNDHVRMCTVKARPIDLDANIGIPNHLPVIPANQDENDHEDDSMDCENLGSDDEPTVQPEQLEALPDNHHEPVFSAHANVEMFEVPVEDAHILEDGADDPEDEDLQCDHAIDNEEDILELLDMFADQTSHTQLEDVVESKPNFFVKLHILWLLQLQSKHSVSDTGLGALWGCFLSLLTKVGIDMDGQLDKPLPKSVNAMRKLVDIDRESVTYVMCSKCHKRHPPKNCVQKHDGKQQSKLCDFVRFRNHKQARLRKECGEPLLKESMTPSGKTMLVPVKTYVYMDMKKSLQRLYSVPGFAENLEHWRENFGATVEADDDQKFLGDVYDGQVWRDYQYVDGKAFLAEKDNLAFQVNIDWFQPFRHTTYSVGAIYMVILNLPRTLRYKIENVLLVGIIDGPREPKTDQINHYLHPLVIDMVELWEGVLIEDSACGIGHRCVRGAILLISSDLPATRKIGGFVGHAANKGCSKCLQEFPRLPNSTKGDYSRFDEDFPSRNAADHKAAAKKTRNCSTVTEKYDMEMAEGVRWTPFFYLPTYDAIRMHVVDAMHCLSGIASHAMEIWKEEKIIGDQNLAEIQKRLDSFVVPRDMGRIPNKVESKFSGLTADQLLTWTVVYSIYALHGLIPKRHLDIWRQFVAACRLLCRKHISVADISTATTLLRRYCVEFRDMYGKDKCNPNMHMSLHLETCIRDYGSVFSTWCFSFERFNGTFEHFHTNKRNVPAQLYRKFTQTEIVNQKLTVMSTHKYFDPSQFTSLRNEPDRGRLRQINSDSWLEIRNLATETDFPVDFGIDTQLQMVTGKKGTKFLMPNETRYITQMVRYLYPGVEKISHSYDFFPAAVVGGCPVTVQRHKQVRSCYVNARSVA